MARHDKRQKDSPLRPLAAAGLAWLIPGAGHVYLGRVRRGVIIFVTITVLFWTGLAIGGVMTIDRESERWWFAADMFAGLHGVVSWRRSERVYSKINADLATDRRYARNVENLRHPRTGRISPQAYAEMRRPYVSALLAKDGLALVPPAETIARTYAGIAGLLNLLCIFDAGVLALMGVAGESAEPKADRADKDAKAVAE